MRKRSLIVLALAVVLVLAFGGTALGWSHAKGAAPIIDHFTTQPYNESYQYVTIYWSTEGAKPLYAGYTYTDANGVPQGTGVQKITHADLVAGYKQVLVPFVKLDGAPVSALLETRKGAQDTELIYVATWPVLN